ncbi:hypothetical protein [Devosia beringensis]|uniref:hypothetical protein n=1 Tax=Devosia beringensis TaxID=2657486 RepID=UPI00186B7AD5|nr:hypothetical protein [Devosia beringensis]
MTESPLFRLCSNGKSTFGKAGRHAKVTVAPGGHARAPLAAVTRRAYFPVLPLPTDRLTAVPPIRRTEPGLQ